MNAPESKKRPFIEPGWYRDMSNEEYHGSFGTSSSQLKTLLNHTPAHLRYNMDQHKESTDAMNLGTALHTLVLEPEIFDEELAVMPDINRRTKAGKEEFAAFEALNAGKIILKPDQYDKAKRMADAVMSQPVARILVEDAITESSIYWWYNSTDPDDDTKFKELLKVRPDGLCRSHPIIFDLKSTVDGTWTEFSKTIEKFGYHVSAAMYKEGVNQCRPLLDEVHKMAYTSFVFVVVESVEPHLVSLYELSPDAMEMGRVKFRHAVHALKRAHDNNWPAFPEEIRVIDLPGWANRLHTV